MLSREDNKLLTRTGFGTPMGDMFRRYWVPIVSSEELEPDGVPVKVKVLDVELVSFRTTDGEVGLVEEPCAHRGTSLAYAINEECGLRCIYHGWKFNTRGECVDIPSEPPESNFKNKVRIKSYPCFEAGGAVWGYLGDQGKEPPKPEFVFFGLPEPHLVVERVWQECNYLQVMENDLDFVHAAFLHRAKQEVQVGEGLLSTDRGINPSHPLVKNPYPQQAYENTTYGQRYIAVGAANEEQQAIMEIHYIYPFYTYPPRFKGEDLLFHAFVPMDDYNTWSWDVHFNLERPIDKEGQRARRGLWLDEEHRKFRNKANRYMQDRNIMKKENFSGILGIANQDHAVTEAMGPIVDRTREHLGSSDVPLIGLRRVLMRAVKQFMDGQDPPIIHGNLPLKEVFSRGVFAPKGISWQEANPLDEKFIPDDLEVKR